MEHEHLPPLDGIRSTRDDVYGEAYDHLARREPREALALVEPALALEPENRGLRVLRAWAFMIRAQLRPAEEELRRLVEENPSDDWSQHALGRVLERQGKGAEGLGHLRMAAVMSGDPVHEAAAARVQRALERDDRPDRGTGPPA